MTDAEPDDVAALLQTDRELTPQEMDQLKQVGEAGWARLTSQAQERAKGAYKVAAPEDFADCVFEHLDPNERAAMIVADVYECPRCGRLLKDRQSPVASVLLLERQRVRDLWLQVERSAPQDRDAALEVFRRALGLPQ